MAQVKIETNVQTLGLNVKRRKRVIRTAHTFSHTPVLCALSTAMVHYRTDLTMSAVHQLADLGLWKRGRIRKLKAKHAAGPRDGAPGGRLGVKTLEYGGLWAEPPEAEQFCLSNSKRCLQPFAYSKFHAFCADSWLG